MMYDSAAIVCNYQILLDHLHLFLLDLDKIVDEDIVVKAEYIDKTLIDVFIKDETGNNYKMHVQTDVFDEFVDNGFKLI